MQTLDQAKMANTQGGGTPSGSQIACAGAAIIYGFLNPFLGAAATITCLFMD